MTLKKIIRGVKMGKPAQARDGPANRRAWAGQPVYKWAPNTMPRTARQCPRAKWAGLRAFIFFFGIKTIFFGPKTVFFFAKN